MNVAEYLANFLVERGVRHVFGYQGGAVVKIIDELVRTKKIEYLQNYHEQASAFCADAYARVSGDVGVAIATSGPGATNLITGIANAQLDSIPVVFITGQEYSSRIKKLDEIRTNGFQDLDIVSVVKPITKYANLVLDGTRIAYELEKAFYIAKSGRPGAVLLDIPIDVQFEQIETETIVHFKPPDDNFCDMLLDNHINKFICMLFEAKRPMILGGGGISLAHSEAEFKKFVELTNIPVSLTLNGLDAYEDFYGFSGLYGNAHANLAISQADLLIVMGARLGQHQVGKDKGSYTDAKIIHVDIDNLELGRAIPEELSIQTDLRLFLEYLNKQLENKVMPDFVVWNEKLTEWKGLLSAAKNSGGMNYALSPIALIQEVEINLSMDAIIAADVGQNQMWAAQSLRLHGQQKLLNSSGLGSMGFALPAAIASKVYRPSANVVAFIGDGGFQINIQELQFIKIYNLDIKIFILNNGTLGMIKSTQDKYYSSRQYGCTHPYYGCPNIEKISEAYGLNYHKISSDLDLLEIKSIMKNIGASIIEVIIDPEYPLETRNDINLIVDQIKFDAQ